MRQIKVLEMTSGVEFAFGSCLTEDITLMSKKISTQVKEANTRLKKTNKSISEIAKTLEVSKINNVVHS